MGTPWINKNIFLAIRQDGCRYVVPGTVRGYREVNTYFEEESTEETEVYVNLPTCTKLNGWYGTENVFTTSASAFKAIK